MDVLEYKLASNNPMLISHLGKYTKYLQYVLKYQVLSDRPVLRSSALQFCQYSRTTQWSVVPLLAISQYRLQALWKLLETVKQKVEGGESESKLTELKYLVSHCESSNGVVSSTACQALVALVESGVLTVSSTIANLTACLVNAKYCGAVASAICDLLTLDLKMWDPENEYVCPFTLKTPQHPLITVLAQKKDAWRDVLSHIRTMMNHCEAGLVKHHVSLLRPIFLYILCNPTLSLPASCRQNSWDLLMKADGTIHVQIEVLHWLRTSNAECCIDTNNRILEIIGFLNISSGEKLFDSALIPLLMSMALEILRHNGDPRPNLDMLSTILQHEHSEAGSVLVCLAAEMIAITPSVYLLDIVTIATTILEKTSCNRTTAHALLPSILQWMAYPSILTSNALDVARNLFAKISNLASKKTSPNMIYMKKPFDQLWHVDSTVQFYTELAICAEHWTPETILPWLDKLSEVPVYVLGNYKLIIGAIFLESKNSSVVLKSCDLLVECAKNGAKILSLILYKLTKSQDIDETRALLFALPKLVGSKENIPIVMHTFKSLSAAGKPLSYLAIELYVQALKFEPRCNRHLLAALIELSSSDSTWKSDVTCARAMRYICEKHSEHGAELVPLLSQTLNRCSKRTGGTASALALKGISALCVAGVTEISSTWRVLAPKMNKEERSVVLQALCEFFGDVPSNPTQEGQLYDKFVNEVLTKLWDYAFNSPDTEVAESAFKALGAYQLEKMPLNVLPEELRKRVESTTIPEETKDNEEENKTQELLSYIPAAYWIFILENIKPNSLTAAGDFLRVSIQEELYSFRTGIYRWPNGEPVNFKYLSEKSPLRAIGEYIRHYKPCENSEKQRIVVECMRIFSHKYPKPLPPVQWKYFDAAIGVSYQARRYGIALACHQAQISSTAKDFVEKCLTTFTKECANFEAEKFKECLDFYARLDDVCRAVGSIVLGPFLEATLNRIVEKSNLDKENAIAMFDEVMGYFGKALKDELIQNDNRSLLTSTLEKLMDRIGVDSKIFRSYVNAALELTSEQLERMTLPSVWLKVTTEKLKKAIGIRAELVLRKTDKTPLSWMNEIIRASASTPAVHFYLLDHLRRFLPKLRLEESNANWTLDLMRRIDFIIVEDKESRRSQAIEMASYMCDILFITVICLAATDCLLTNDRTLAASHDVRAKLFPLALANIVQVAYWKDIVSHIMEWLNHMRTSPIPRIYKIVFHNALVSLKNESYFDVVWTKYLSVRAPN